MTYKLLSTVNVTTAGVTQIDLTGISSSYASLQVRANLASSAASFDALTGQINGDTGTGNTYGWSQSRRGANGTTTISSDSLSRTGATTSHNFGFLPGTNLGTSGWTYFIYDLFNYSNTNLWTTGKFIVGYAVYNNADSLTRHGNVIWKNTATVTSISLIAAGFRIGSQVSLYGFGAV